MYGILWLSKKSLGLNCQKNIKDQRSIKKLYIFAVRWKNIGSYWQYIIVYFCLHYASFKHNRPRDAYTEIPNGMWIFNLILKSLQYILYASYKLLISIDEDEVVSNV